MDQHGVRWPLVYTRLFGSNDPVMHIYALLPLQWLAGMNIWTLRLTGAFAGIASVLLVYFAGNRFFGRPVGLIAAALLALNPWSLGLSRLYMLAGFSPALVLLTLLAMAWAGLPVCDRGVPIRVWRTVVAAAIAGLACHGYWALRVVLPLTVIGIVLVNGPAWLALLKTRRGALALGLGAAVGLTLIAPLVWLHTTDPSGIGKRGERTLIWNNTGTWTNAAGEIALRYVGHFGPDFLFARGDRFNVVGPPGWGQFHWYCLPLMLAGLGTLAWKWRNSAAARTLLVGLLLYPLGDSLASHVSLHALPKFPRNALAHLAGGRGGRGDGALAAGAHGTGPRRGVPPRYGRALVRRTFLARLLRALPAQSGGTASFPDAPGGGHALAGAAARRSGRSDLHRAYAEPALHGDAVHLELFPAALVR